MKTAIIPYLTFDGNCEEAFNFYKSVFGGEFSYIGRFKDMPPQEDMPLIPEEYANRIMHIALPLDDGAALFGSDNGEWAPKLIKGNNISISLNFESTEKAKQVFTKLSDGGVITMPPAETFWAAYFAMFTDKFGINWMINVEHNK